MMCNGPETGVGSSYSLSCVRGGSLTSEKRIVSITIPGSPLGVEDPNVIKTKPHVWNERLLPKAAVSNSFSRSIEAEDVLGAEHGVTVGGLVGVQRYWAKCSVQL